ncbi:putative RNA-binding protein YlmH [Melissococcus plutonius]|uniref:RNA-binding S4 domain-containing protein n=2 Tax=Melissococcus plutonius TaxID=33970 RepID=F3Y9R6_MELPT|nr:putative RNA-binding protein YlmH [Melissococcus plutonius S1]KMT24893.1 putative RNA-binding protein YlmH [Melissococcus plutonius]BAK21244.1 hypothetical protein, contains S4-like RNA binding domain [Melissococcus plutonius ATCC 35311]BAL62377.1 hypothetical protein MPD5_1157 [Melissococcus plutonius DAT561]KMT26530.1 putative RNA-binding protein YlmH [Melissococcus plutonius]
MYQHFRKDEHPFIDTVNSWLSKVELYYSPYLTNFLDPRQAYILETLVHQNNDLLYKFYGGYENAERQRCMIYPSYYQPSEEDFKISLVEITYPIKFATLSHGKILGTLVNMGIKREYFGDIISNGTKWQIFIGNEIESYIINQLDRIGKTSVYLSKKEDTELIVPKDNWIQEIDTVSSLRLDNLISAVYNISRQHSKKLIESGKVKVNWMENGHPDFIIGLQDIISIRGYGRIQLQAIENKTKKGKYRINLGVLKK